MIKPYSKNNVLDLWSDPYISQKMLEYNLQTDNDIVSRNINDVKKTVKYVINKYHLVKGSTLCDLGCGAGIYTNLFQKKGLNVTGIDISHKAIEYAKKHNKRVEYIEANYMDLKFDKKFDFITMIYCDFGLLTDDNRGLVLDKVHSILNDEGLFMFDVWNHKFYDEVPPMNVKYEEVDGFYMAGKSNVSKKNYKYDDLHLILTKTIAKGSNKKIEVSLWDKFFSIEEIKELLSTHKLKIEDIHEEEYCITVVCKKE